VAHTPRLTVDQGALGVGSTEYIRTWTFAVRTLVGLGTDTHLAGAAKSVSRTVVVLVAGFDADTFRRVVGVCYRPCGAPTLVGSGQVLTGCSETAGAYRLTLINIDTSDLRIASIPRLALADEAAGYVGTQAVLPAGARGSTLVHINTASSDILRVICPPIFTHTVRILSLCLAVRVLATGYTFTRL